MNKQTYLAKLAQLLAPLPEQERQDALNYYEEYFDAAGPEAEDATAAELGTPADIFERPQNPKTVEFLSRFRQA